MTTVQDVLFHAADLIEEKGWLQDRAVDRHSDAMCLSQAVFTAAYELSSDGRDAYLEVGRRLGFNVVSDRDNPTRWNDTEGRTVDEVLAVLRGE